MSHSTLGMSMATTLRILFLGAAYFAASLLGNMLVVGAGYGSLMWPAAGIAFAALLVWNVKLWPGIWLGSLAFNCWLDNTTSGIIIAMIVASGSSLQAYAGVRLTNLFFQKPIALLTGSDLLLSLTVAGPLVCTISASTGILTLHGFGVIPPDLLFSKWLTWWSGDSLGVILFAPILILTFQSATGVKISVPFKVGLPLIISAIFLTVANSWFNEIEESRARKVVLYELQTVANSLSVEWNSILNSTRALEIFFDLNKVVDRHEFFTFSRIIEKHSPVRAVDWAPRILASERTQFEKEARRTGSPDYKIRSLGFDAPTLKQPDLFPVLYSAPERQFSLVSGLDHGSTKNRRAAIRRAIETGQMQVVLEENPLAGSAVTSAIFLFQPVYSPNVYDPKTELKIRDGDFKGIVLCIIDPQVLFASLGSNTYEVIYRISDLSNPEKPTRVFGSLPSGFVPLSVQPLNFAGEHWQIELTVANQYWHSLATAQSRVYLLITMVSAYLVAFSVLGSADRSAAAQVLIAERTAELAHARDEAVSANAAKSSFLATMSHEIRTPMSGVISMIEILLGTPLTERQKNLIVTAKHSAHHLMSVIDNILDFSKIEAGGMVMESSPVSIRRLSDCVVTSLSAVADKKAVDLSLHISTDTPDLIMSDEVRLRQVLFNLIGNAIKFSAGDDDRRGQVVVSIQIEHSSTDKLVITVKDNGVGLSEEAQANIFRPFTQAETSTTRRFGGTGLGLAICQRIVDQWQGKIEVISTQGEGATFRLLLPLAAVLEESNVAQPDLSGLRCILVRDSDFNRDDVSLQLEGAGAFVQVTEDLESAAQLASTLDAPILIYELPVNCIPEDYLDSAMTAAPDARHLIITRGRRMRARIEAVNATSLDANMMWPRALLEAVALAVQPSQKKVVSAVSDSESFDPAVQSLAQSVDAARATGMLILVAEDDETNQNVIRLQLETLGYACEIADNGVKALELWRSGHYALLLSDLFMPQMDGYELTASIRKEEQDTRIPIFILSANAITDEIHQAKGHGADEYVTKPVSLHQLQVLIERWLPWAREEVPLATDRPADAGPGVFDVNVLKALVGDNPTVIISLLNDFLVSIESRCAELHNACTQNDQRSVAAIAHKLKSAARSVGALDLGRLFEELEILGKVGRSEQVHSFWPKISSAVEVIEIEIRHYLHSET
jgi:signal transduction histidine kinase/CheY-like chemotaxis protein/HPt (histidine-containing phosphotransfer) domain-containing protein